MKMEECCLSPKDEGNFVAKANGFARVRRTRAKCFARANGFARVRWTRANASRGSVGRGRMLREGLLDEGNFVARVFDEKIALEYVRTYLTLVF